MTLFHEIKLLKELIMSQASSLVALQAQVASAIGTLQGLVNQVSAHQAAGLVDDSAALNDLSAQLQAAVSAASASLPAPVAVVPVAPAVAPAVVPVPTAVPPQA